jgi:DNA repair protein RecO (recombination protein O)
MESTAALLLRRTKFSDTSLVVTWLTCDFGKLKTMARGALRPKSPFAGGIDLFFETEIAFVRSRRSEIHTLREVTLRNSFEGLRRDYSRVEMASYFVELMELMTEPEQPVPELFDLLCRAFKYLENAIPNRRALLHFESELARLLGIHIEGNAHAALSRVCHHLPDSRRRLMEKLPENGL